MSKRDSSPVVYGTSSAADGHGNVFKLTKSGCTHSMPMASYTPPPNVVL